jgi:hypothetical protein
MLVNYISRRVKCFMPNTTINQTSLNLHVRHKTSPLKTEHVYNIIYPFEDITAGQNMLLGMCVKIKYFCYFGLSFHTFYSVHL